MKNNGTTDYKWGLVLAGGGGKGAYQAGVFKAMEEYGLTDRIIGISGTSVGALNMVLFAYGDIALAQRIWSDITPASFLKVDMKLIDHKEAVMSRKGLIELIDNYLNLETVSLYPYPLYAACTEVNGIIPDLGKMTLRLSTIVSEISNTGNKVEYFKLNGRDRTNIKEIMLASSALPVIYEPVRIGSRLYLDGGLKDNLPVTPLYKDGIRHFIIISLSEHVDEKTIRKKYPSFEFEKLIVVSPSKDIGELITGTLDFTSRGARSRLELGYDDAIKIFEKM